MPSQAEAVERTPTHPKAISLEAIMDLFTGDTQQGPVILDSEQQATLDQHINIQLSAHFSGIGSIPVEEMIST